MILPLNTTLVVSQRSLGDVFGKSLISKKDVHTFEIWTEIQSFSKDILKCHLENSFKAFIE